MRRMIVLVPESVHADLALAAASLPVTLVPYSEEGPLPTELPEAEGIFRVVKGTRFSELIEKGPKIRWLHTASAGVDHVLTPAVRNKPGLTVTDSGAIFDTCIGEFVLGWMLALAHRIPETIDGQKRQAWEWRQSTELSGQTVGVIGLGPIGRGIATRCKALGMTTLGYRRSLVACPDVEITLTGRDGLERLLRESDWVVVAAALTDETRALLGEQELALLKPTARLINIARGPLVEEDALLTALTEGRLAGAVLDVFHTEPLPVGHPLWSAPNTFVTCHSSAWTDGLRERQRAYFLQNLARFVRGEALEGVVELTRGY